MRARVSKRTGYACWTRMMIRRSAKVREDLLRPPRIFHMWKRYTISTHRKARHRIRMKSKRKRMAFLLCKTREFLCRKHMLRSVASVSFYFSSFTYLNLILKISLILFNHRSLSFVCIYNDGNVIHFRLIYHKFNRIFGVAAQISMLEV
jgi:hypothetical protein